VVVEVGLLEDEAVRLTAPFRTLVQKARPWVIAKWAMTRDRQLVLPAKNRGPESVARGDWISSAASRAIVHDLRRRVDGILIGIGTAVSDDPLLTARPPGPRPLVRVVLDRTARLPLASRLVQTAPEEPLLVAVGPEAPVERVTALEQSGCEVWRSESPDSATMLTALCTELGQRQLTNVMVEGGTGVLRAFFAVGLVDEVWAFIAPRLAGGGLPFTGPPASLPPLTVEAVEQPGGDLFLRGLT